MIGASDAFATTAFRKPIAPTRIISTTRTKVNHLFIIASGQDFLPGQHTGGQLPADC
jgi:hypothetical protein